ncbi:DUF6325 family protein [Actinotalea sp.]|uniref:DUF6325 family protein n=1 Tax=Actinotalea sp. TaxID=1872145 RepID=UPI002BB146AC|nr:DUF6325 family protein [Actinotalea sp.]HQY32485.1 DUF6325 family protein [Actinotalea sp.]HRA50078.1 DUF6325 family protein [Actinotalea sp.]
MPVGLDPDLLGPVDVALIVFEGNTFTGEVAPALVELQSSGIVRIIDVAFVSKALDGTTTVLEVEDVGIAQQMTPAGADQFDLLSDEDLAEAAAELAPGTSELVVVWENTWASRLATAVRESNGTLTALHRIPRHVVLDAISALDEA